MNQRNNEKFIAFLVTLASAGLIVETLLMHWEFWVPPVIMVGMAAAWMVNLSEQIDPEHKKLFYFVHAALLLFYLGVHDTGFFDIALASVLAMVTYSLLGRVYMMNFILAEYFVLLFIHLINLPGGEPLVYNRTNVSSILLHVCIVILVYFISVRTINDHLEAEEENKAREKSIAINDLSMEDFLSNISHELRTPVNVVCGMSDLLIKKGVGDEAVSIKSAGIRLANQIEDIQDYTECKRRNIFLEEDNYTSTSLINDVVTGFRMNESAGDLDLVVDLDPRVPAMMRGDIKKLHKMFRHLLENAIKFTRKGGVYVHMYTEPREYGVNLCIEMTDTGIGMDRHAMRAVREGMYQENKNRNRSTGGIGLGLFIVYGFAHRMGGFVKIESEKGTGTTIRVTIPQKAVDKTPCLTLDAGFNGAVLFHVRPDKYRVPKLRDFYRNMAANLARGMHVPLYSAETVYEVERLKEKLNVSYVFMGQEEYTENRGYFEELAREDIVVAVSAGPEFTLPENSKVLLLPKPLYAYPIIKILNEGRDARNIDESASSEKPVFTGVKALIVDDEPMNLVVAASLFKDYEMIIDTAGGGREAIRKFRENDYDLIFMDHMMPEMDGVEAMRLIRDEAEAMKRKVLIVALTANTVSGAREMFLKEGFDGFIAKPINIADFERVMLRVLSGSAAAEGGETRWI